MTINHVYNIIDKTMKILEEIDLMDITKRAYNQGKINNTYKLLDDFRDELIRENIKNKV